MEYNSQQYELVAVIPLSEVQMNADSYDDAAGHHYVAYIKCADDNWYTFNNLNQTRQWTKVPRNKLRAINVLGEYATVPPIRGKEIFPQMHFYKIMLHVQEN